MRKRLQLQLRRRIAADDADLLERKLPCQHNALCAELMPRGRAGGVRDADLCRDVQLAVRRLALRHAEHTKVRDDQGVDAAVVQQARRSLGQRLQQIIVDLVEGIIQIFRSHKSSSCSR